MIRRISTAGAVLATLLLTGSCAAGSAGSGSDVITVGLLTAETGNLNFSSGRYGFELAVDRINAAGGVNGHKIEIVTAEAGTDPTLTASAARQLVDQKNVDVLASSMAVADCPVNADYYAARGVAVLTPAFDAGCFAARTMFPYMPDGRYNLAPGAAWALDKGSRVFGYIGLDVPANHDLAANLRKQVEAKGATWAGESYVAQAGGGDVTGAVVRLKQAGAKAVLVSLDPGYLGPALKVAAEQGIGLGDGVTWIEATGGYGEASAKALGAAGDGLYVCVNNAPYEDPEGGTADLAAAMRTAHPDTPLDGFGAIGWAGAQVLRDVLGRVQGAPDRAAILAAARATADAKPGTNPATIDFTHTPVAVPVYGRMVQLEGGRWNTVSDWVRTEPV